MVGFPHRVEVAARRAPGRLAGRITAPIFTFLARVRRGRPLHPEGICVVGEALDERGSDEPLSGPVLVRLSAGLWRGWHAKPDALGIAIRFGTSQRERQTGELDLLVSTFGSMATLPLAPLTTDTRDFLANTYWAVMPFDIDGLGRCHLRVVPATRESVGEDRAARLRTSIMDGGVILNLEVRTTRGWHRLARIVLHQELEADLGDLRFDPSAAGRGVAPRGFLAAVRREVYPRVQKHRRS